MTNDNDATFQELWDAQREIDRLKAENSLRADNVRLAAALSQARLQTISLREAGHAAMRTDYAAEAVGDVNEGDAAAFYLEGFEAAVKEIRKVEVTTALRDLLALSRIIRGVCEALRRVHNQ